MLYVLPRPIRGVITGLLFLLNTLLTTLLVFPFALFVYIVPSKKWRKKWLPRLHAVPELWTKINFWIMKLMMKLHIEVEGVSQDLKFDDWYLMLSNHQSWVDIIILYHVFNKKIPSLRFFMKKELLWQLPIAAQACQLLHYPFMQRYSKDFLTKHPLLKGKDIDSTRRACEKFKDIPITLINFVEGGRFTREKYQRQQPPYQHLLRPKAGGVAFVLSTMGKFLHKILNVTIIYPNGNINLWDFFSGKIKTIIVKVECLPIRQDLLGDYENDPIFRAQFQQWLNNLWHEKDELIENILNEQIGLKS